MEDEASADQTPPEVTGSDLTLSGHITAKLQNHAYKLWMQNSGYRYCEVAYLVTAPCPFQHLSLVEQTEDNYLLS